MAFKKIIALTLLSLMIGACGIKGPLHLPKEEKQESSN